MIIGIGTDIVDIRRIERTLERQGDRFVRRILTEAERVVFDARGGSAVFLATRFAAKEAAAKALGTGIGQVSFQDVAITNHESGVPALVFSDAAWRLCERHGVVACHVTLSDEREYAVAFVVLEGRGFLGLSKKAEVSLINCG